jgi:hypothetical protein
LKGEKKMKRYFEMDIDEYMDTMQDILWEEANNEEEEEEE